MNTNPHPMTSVPIEQIPGVRVIRAVSHPDERGRLIKLPLTADFIPADIFHTHSHAGVIRGMHATSGPMPCQKLVFRTSGMAVDVIVDLRKSSPAYGAHASIILLQNETMLLLPPGVAHGFCALATRTTMFYAHTAPFDPNHDLGVRWNSIGFDWMEQSGGLFNSFTVSPRDAGLPALKDFATPFR